MSCVKYRRSAFILNVERIYAICGLAGSIFRKRSAGLFINSLGIGIGALELETLAQSLDNTELQRIVPGVSAIGEEIHTSKMRINPRVARQPAGSGLSIDH